MKKIADNPWLIELPRLVLGIFVILNIIAMLSYPGGTFLDDTTVGYSFTRNFLSRTQIEYSEDANSGNY